MKSFTIQEIRKYIESQDSLGDVLYNLSESAIDAANRDIDENSEAYKEGREEYSPYQKLRNPYSDVFPEHKEYAAGWNSMHLEYESATWSTSRD